MKSYNEGISHLDQTLNNRSMLKFQSDQGDDVPSWRVETIYIPTPLHSCLSHKTTWCHQITFYNFSCPLFAMIIIYGQFLSIYSTPLLLSRSCRQNRTKHISLWCDVLCTVLCIALYWYCTDYRVNHSSVHQLRFVSSEPPTSPSHHEQQQLSAHFLRHHHSITFLHQPGCRSSNQHTTRQTL